MSKVKLSLIQKKEQESVALLLPKKNSIWTPRISSFGVINLALLASGTVAIIQGGFWIALIIYIINLIALFWHNRK